jgi:D-lyxose ketol-isomerase
LTGLHLPITGKLFILLGTHPAYLTICLATRRAAAIIYKFPLPCIFFSFIFIFLTLIKSFVNTHFSLSKMKTTTFAVALLGLFPAIFAQETLAPSPTESVGCEPHGDHWHCEGARSTLAAEAKATTDAEHDDDHDHDHDHDTTGTESLAPSPTESTGCEPHGDHWHCEAAKTGSEAKATDDHDHDHEDEDHTHSAGATKSLSPSPTESVGCEPHGDHWHCDGPATAAATGSASASATESDSAAVTDNAAGIQMIPFAGIVAAAVLAL